MEVEKRSYIRRNTEANTHIAPVKGPDATAQGQPAWLTTYAGKFGQLFTVPRIRRATIAAIVCMISQQLCGVNVLSFYSTTLFHSANNENCGSTNQTRDLIDTSSDNIDITALWLSWGIGLSNFVFAFPAYRLIDSRGRRWLMLVTLPFMALSMLGAGLCFLIPDGSSAHAPVISVFLFIFMFFYSWGVGPVPFTLSAEVFPLENRVAGMSFAVFVNLFGAGLLTLFVPSLTNALGHPGLLGIFAGLNVLAFVLVFLFVRETAGAAIGRRGLAGGMFSVSLEELNYIFEVTTKRHWEYQLRYMLPWTFENFGKLLLFRDVEPPEKCYNWSGDRQEQEQEMQPVLPAHN